MKLWLTLGLLLPLVATATETVAWRIPLDMVVSGGISHPGISRADKVPGESKFFQPGDELWDLSKAIKASMDIRNYDHEVNPFEPTTPHITRTEEESFEGEFVVWNARSESIVARGTPHQLGVVDQAIDLMSRPKQLKISLLSASEDAEQELHLMVRSGEKGDIEEKGRRLEVAATLAVDGSLVGVALTATIPVPGGHHEVNTAAILQPGVPIEIARWQLEDTTCKLSMAAETWMAWGVRLNEVRRIEGQAHRLAGAPVTEERINGLRFAGGLQGRVFHVPPDFLARVDPSSSPLRRLKLPEALEGFLPPTLIDAREAMEDNGVSFDDELAVAGFDPRGSTLLVINTPEALDLIEMIACHGSEGPYVARIALEWGKSSASILCRSGEKSSITRAVGEKSFPLLETAANIASDKSLIDCMIQFRTPDERMEMNNAVTITDGGRLELGGGAEPVFLRAEVLEIEDDS